MYSFGRWFQMNILLPLSPFALRLFIIYIGNEDMVSRIRIFELPELLFFSVFTCITGLNINLYGPRKHFESFVRFFLAIIIILDFVALGVIYSESSGPNSLYFSLTSIVIPTIITSFYKFIDFRKTGGGIK